MGANYTYTQFLSSKSGYLRSFPAQNIRRQKQDFSIQKWQGSISYFQTTEVWDSFGPKVSLNRVLFVMTLVLLPIHAKSQREILHFDYGMMPSVGNTSVADLSLGFTQRIFSGTNALSVYMDYLKRDYDFFISQTLRPSEEADRIHQFKLGVDYTLSLGRSYELKAAFVPTISSTWSSALLRDDFFWNYSVQLVKTWSSEKGSAAVRVGISRVPLFGEPKPIPTLSFLKEWNNQWFLELGFPSSSIRKQLNERHGIGMGFSFVGTYVNISNPITIDSIVGIDAVGLVQNGNEFSLNHTYRLQPNFTTTIKVGYQFVNEFELQDSSGNRVFDL